MSLRCQARIVSGVTIEATARSALCLKTSPLTARRLRSSSVKANLFAFELVLENSVLFLDVRDHVVLMPVHPADTGHEQELLWSRAFTNQIVHSRGPSA